MKRGRIIGHGSSVIVNNGIPLADLYKSVTFAENTNPPAELIDGTEWHTNTTREVNGTMIHFNGETENNGFCIIECDPSQSKFIARYYEIPSKQVGSFEKAVKTYSENLLI